MRLIEISESLFKSEDARTSVFLCNDGIRKYWRCTVCNELGVVLVLGEAGTKEQAVSAMKSRLGEVLRAAEKAFTVSLP